MPRNDHLKRDLSERLRGLVERGYRPGEALPSQRALAEMHGVGLATVHRVLKALADDGLVEIRPGSGAVRAGGPRRDSKPPAALRLGIITRRSEIEWVRKAGSLPQYTELKKAVEARGGEVVWVTNRKLHHPTPARNRIEAARIPWNDFDVAVLCEVEDAATLSRPLWQRHPVLALDQDATPFGLRSLTFDDYAIGRTVARYLYDLGHRRFAVTEEASGEGWPSENAWITRRHGFELMAGRLGCGVWTPHRVCAPHHGRGTGMTLEGVAEETAERWARMRGEHRPTALFAPAPTILPHLLPALARRGLHVPRDLSVVIVTWHAHPVSVAAAMVDEGRTQFEEGEYTRVYLDLPALARRCVEAADALRTNREDFAGYPTQGVSGTAARLVLAPYVLQPGRTTAPRAVT